MEKLREKTNSSANTSANFGKVPDLAQNELLKNFIPTEAAASEK